jgi:hypothetical protein
MCCFVSIFFAQFLTFLGSLLLFSLAISQGGGRIKGDSIKKPTNLSQLIPMKKTILALALAAGLTSFAVSAKADITFNWTETGSDLGNGAGTISVNSNYLSGMLGGGFSISDFTGSIGDRSLNFNYATLVNFDRNRGDSSYSFTGNSQITDGSMVFTLDGLDDHFGLSIQYDGSASFASMVSGQHAGDFTFSSQTAAVPEPSQVAASLLLTAGIAGFVIVKRRKEASELEAFAA